METTSVRPSVRLSTTYQRPNGLSNFLDIRYRNFLRKTDERLDFHASKLVTVTLHWGPNEYVPLFSVFLDWYRKFPRNACQYVYHENRHNKSHNLLQDVNAAYRNFLRFPSYL